MLAAQIAIANALNKRVDEIRNTKLPTTDFQIFINARINLYKPIVKNVIRNTIVEFKIQIGLTFDKLFLHHFLLS